MFSIFRRLFALMLSKIGAMVPAFFVNVPWYYWFLDMIPASISCHSCNPVIYFSFNWNSPAQIKL